MKKNVIGTIALISLGVFVLFGVIAAVLAGAFVGGSTNDGMFSFNGIGGESFDIDFDESYDLDGVEKIKINVVSSNVNLYNSNETIDVLFQGQGKSMKGNVELIVENQDNMLYIYVSYPKFGNIRFMDSQLSVGVPAEFDGEIEVRTISGRVELSNMDNDIDVLTVDTTSGNLNADVKSINELFIDTTSGKSIVNSVINEKVKADSTSGNFEIEKISADASMVDAHSVSGKITVSYALPCKTDIDTTSGDVYLTFDSQENMYIDFDSTSGDLEGNYSTNSNGILVKVNTTSGDLTVQ